MIYREKICSRYLSILVLIPFFIPQELYSDSTSAKESAASAQAGMLVLLKQGSLRKGVTTVDRKLWAELLDQWVASLKELGIDEEPKQIKSTIIGLMNKQNIKSLKEMIKILAGKDNTQGSVRSHIQAIKLEKQEANPDKENLVNQHKDVFKQRPEVIKLSDEPMMQNSNIAWAARLDFLCSLDAIAFDASGNSIPLVNFKDSNSSSASITIASQDLTGGLLRDQKTITSSQAVPPVAIIKSIDGSLPESVRWADVPDKGTATLNSNGTGLDNLQRGRFAKGIDYTKLKDDINTQGQLWIVPNVNANGTIDDSASILSSILSAQQSAHDFKKGKRSSKMTVKHERNHAIILSNYVLPLVDALAKSLA